MAGGWIGLIAVLIPAGWLILWWAHAHTKSMIKLGSFVGWWMLFFSPFMLDLVMFLSPDAMAVTWSGLSRSRLNMISGVMAFICAISGISVIVNTRLLLWAASEPASHTVDGLPEDGPVKTRHPVKWAAIIAVVMAVGVKWDLVSETLIGDLEFNSAKKALDKVNRANTAAARNAKKIGKASKKAAKVRKAPPVRK